ncbi:MAG: AMP-binding protein, partial [Natronomonas sp.]|uniref:AMP-binding protein n=1 Tax=Natronomonas sp. TaxID=2184060 RepID=UPI00287053B4
MQPHVPDEKLPDADSGPDLVHAVPEVHYPNSINVTTELVDRHVEEGHGDDVAIRFEDDETTYAALQEKVNSLGNSLSDAGVEPGHRVLVRFPNRP